MSEPATVGRPREFDDEAVIDAVVELFRERGYSSTSIGDVVERTGLSKSSLYGAFGSKDELFALSLRRYVERQRSVLEQLFVHSDDGLDAIDAFLDMAGAEARGSRSGCLVVNTSTEPCVAHSEIAELTTTHRATLRQGFVAVLKRAVELDGFDPGAVADTANALVALSSGLGVMVRAGASIDEVDSTIASTKRWLRSGTSPG